MSATRTRTSSAGPAILGLVLVASGQASGDTRGSQVSVSWDGGAGTTNWGDPTNWNPDVVPDNGTPAGTTYAVTIDDGTPGGFSVGLLQDVSIDSLIVGAGDGLGVDNDRVLTVVQSGPDTGTIVNAGILTFATIGAPGRLRASGGDVTLSGGGLVFAGIIDGTGPPARLVNLDNTIHPAGQIGLGTASFTNHGTLQLQDPIGLTVDVADDVFLNLGLVDVAVAVAMVLEGTDSYVQTAGATIVHGTLVVSGGGLDLQGGDLAGSGLISANPFVSSGRVIPLGVLHAGIYAQTPAGILDIRILDPVSGPSGRLEVSSTATLAGGLTASLLNGYVPPDGQVFTILTAGTAVTGTFAGLPNGAPLPLPGGGGFIVNYTPTSVTLTYDPSVPIQLMSLDVS